MELYYQVLSAAGVALFLIAYRLVKSILYPRPLPGIPYDPEAVKRWRGDQPTVAAAYRRHHEWISPMAARSAELGSPVHQLFMNPFSAPIVLVDDPREVTDIMLRRNRDFDKSTGNPATQILFPRSTLTSPTNAHWKKQRAAWRDTMHPEFLRRVVAPHIYKAALDLTRLWEARSRSSGNAAAVGDDKSTATATLMDASNDFSLAALDAIWAAIFGQHLDLVQAETEAARTGQPATAAQSKGAMVAQTVNHVNVIFEQWGKALWPAFTLWRIKRSREFREYMALRDREIGRLLSAASARFARILSDEKAAANGGEEHDSCAMDLVLRRSLLAAQKAGRPLPDPASDSDMKDELMLMIFAGHDTTSITMQWFLKFMTNNPEAQTRLRSALLDTLGSSSSNELPECADLLSADVPYLDAVIEETARCASTATRGNRVALHDTEILGHPIPKGTHVMCSFNVRWKPVAVPEDVRSPSSRAAAAATSANAAKANWTFHPAAQDLDDFRPERWLKMESTAGDKLAFDPDVLPRNSFGGGIRGCFGKRLAMIELRIMMCLTILRFKFLPVPENLNSPLPHERLLRAPLQCYVKLQPITSTNSRG